MFDSKRSRDYSWSEKLDILDERLDENKRKFRRNFWLTFAGWIVFVFFAAWCANV